MQTAHTLAYNRTERGAHSSAGVPLSIARQMVGSGKFRPSLGWTLDAEHYRCPLDDGGCMHLVIFRHHARMHRDQFDPERDPISFVLHQIVDAPVQTALLIGAFAVLRGLFR